MNKSIKVVSLFFLLGGASFAVGESRQYEENQLEEVREIDDFDDEFEDFFGCDQSKPRTIERVEKEKLSRAKIIMIRLGIKAAMAGEAFYKWTRSVCAYLKSLVWHEA